MKKRRGFTLIEVVITMVVIGVLVSIALVTKKSFLDRSRGNEARSILSQGYAGYQRMLAENETIGSGNPLSWRRMGMTDPNSISGRNFNYSISPTSTAPTSLVARKGGTGCSGSGSSHNLTLNLSTGKITEQHP